MWLITPHFPGNFREIFDKGESAENLLLSDVVYAGVIQNNKAWIILDFPEYFPDIILKIIQVGKWVDRRR